MQSFCQSLWLPLSAASLLFAPAASAVTIDWVTVGGAGNACDTQPQGCFGAVPYTYRISKYEVTNDQYAEFLNAVADTDTNGLYSTSMGSVVDLLGGVVRSGSSGSFSYSPIVGREDMPVNYVSFYDSLRFANWLHNDQPTGAQGNATTEDGAYTITPAGIVANSIVRNAGATIFLTSEDEWYKAAYYDAVSTSYFDYPAGSDTQTTCNTPGAVANTANCDFAIGPQPFPDLAGVGSYTGAASPNGTFDQGGNVGEWNEATGRNSRPRRGGSFAEEAEMLAASFRLSGRATGQSSNTGFRVASVVPEPATGLLLMTGLLAAARWGRPSPSDPRNPSGSI